MEFDSKEYEKLAIDNIKLMYYLLNKYKYEFNNADWFDEFKESFMPQYIICCKMYDISKGYNFSAYLSQAVYYYFCMWKNRKQNKFFIQRYSVSLGATVTDDDHYLEQVIEDKRVDVDSAVLINEIIKYIKDNRISKEKKDILELTMAGYKQFEIANKLKCNQTHISRKLKRVREIIKCELLK